MENQYFIHQCDTAPQARGLGIYPAVLNRIINDFNNNSEILICVNRKNLPSIKGVLKAGFIEKSRYRIYVICGIRYSKCTNNHRFPDKPTKL